jgi:23S rRNA pseudouridine1911/1915/1917 synthase
MEDQEPIDDEPREEAANEGAPSAAPPPAGYPEPPSQLIAGAEHSGSRLDAYLAYVLPQFSRMRLRKAINDMEVLVNGKRSKCAYHIHAGDVISLSLSNPKPDGPEPCNIPLDVLYEDEVMAAINKPPGMVVHPGKGNWKGTLTSALAYHFAHLSTIGGPSRPGIVHRLDRDTSGVILVAKNDPAHSALAEQFESRETKKEYFAIVAGNVDRDQELIDAPIGLHPHQREKMMIRDDHESSRPAQTIYHVAERFDGFTAVHCFPKTGRTHQIRVHMMYRGYPVLCDKLYGGRSQITLGEITRRRDDDTVILSRQALHAHRITIKHPLSKKEMTLEAPIPADLQGVLEALRTYRKR